MFHGRVTLSPVGVSNSQGERDYAVASMTGINSGMLSTLALHKVVDALIGLVVLLTL